MTENLFSRRGARLARTLCAAVLVAVCAAASRAQSSAPVLLTEGTGTTTRAVAYDSVTRASEPFNVVSNVKWHPDGVTRVMLFAMNVRLFPGEGANAMTADAEDATGRRYPLTIDYIAQVPGQDWLYSIVVRLNEEIGDVGDLFVRVNHHGFSSNRVRVAVGHVGGGLTDQAAGASPAPAPPTPPAPLPPPTPNPFTSAATTADTVRFLEQTTWGPTNAEVARVQAMGFRAYLNEQFNAPVGNPAKGSNYPDLAFPLDDQNQACPTGPTQAACVRDNFTLYPVRRTFFTSAMTGQDQLRQRVAFALHQIFVVSGRDLTRPSWMTVYLQTLDRGAFGNFRTLLGEITLNPEMGEYLDMNRSTAGNPNENFAREVLQLFSIGVNELNTDGTPKLDAQGSPIPTYSQATVDNFTRVLTGWRLANSFQSGVTNYRDPMVPRGGSSHDAGTKTLLNGLTLPANQTIQQDLTAALDNIFNHPNVGPFIGKQLIQHLVTSNPSPAYVSRVARVFNNDCDALYPDGCTSVRGNMRAVVQAILLDPEARGDVKTDPNYGRLREPIQYMNNLLRAFDAKSFDKTSTSDGVLAGSHSPADFPNLMDQPLYLPATVFSYYPPDYEVPGTKILGPVFNILSTSTTLRRANFVNTMAYTGVTATTTSTDRPRGTSLDFAPLEAVAADPQQLVSTLDSLLMHGTMSAQMRASVVGAISSIPTSDANFARKRAQMAVYLVATSSQYQVQR